MKTTAAGTEALDTPAPAGRLARWWASARASAWARGGFFAALVGLIGVSLATLLAALGWTAKGAEPTLRTTATVLLQLVPAVSAYVLVALWIERRPLTELAPSRLIPGLAAGVAGGTALIAAVIGVLWLAGAYAVSGTGEAQGWVRTLLIAGVGAAVSEEIIFRGVLYRLIAESKGDAWALSVSALLFGALHMGNPNATLWTSFAIAVEAGVLLGVVYAVTRSLWPCIGLHMAWNFLEGQVFGSPVSGRAVPDSLLTAKFSGPEWLTGGAFGIEGSVVTVVLSLGASLVLVLLHRRRLLSPPSATGAPPC